MCHLHCAAPVYGCSGDRVALPVALVEDRSGTHAESCVLPVPIAAEEAALSTHLEQLMHDATSLAEQVRRARLEPSTQPQSTNDLKLLEERLAHTWSAI